jgi:hypothetical protein
MNAGIADLDRLIVYIKYGKIAEKLRAVCPGNDFDFATDAVGVNDLAAFQ